MEPCQPALVLSEGKRQVLAAAQSRESRQSVTQVCFHEEVSSGRWLGGLPKDSKVSSVCTPVPEFLGPW